MRPQKIVYHITSGGNTIFDHALFWPWEFLAKNWDFQIFIIWGMIIHYNVLFLAEKSNAIIIFKLKPSPSSIQDHALFTVGILGQKLRFSNCRHMRHRFTLDRTVFAREIEYNCYFWAKSITNPNTGPHPFLPWEFSKNNYDFKIVDI